MPTKLYDAVIVGAGIAGAIVASKLARARKTVLILEAGRATATTAEGYQAYVDNYYTTLAKVPNAGYPSNGNAPSPSVLDLHPITPGVPDASGYLVQTGPVPFSSDYLRAKGGTTLHWLGTCLRMLPNDFRLKSQYGQGVDWPITYEQLRPYYEEAEWGIGVSGDVDRQKIPGAGPDFYRPKYTYPMRGLPQSYLDQHIAAALRGASVTMSGETIPLDVIPTPQGRNSTPNGDYRPEGSVGDAHLGERCEGNASCVPICPVQAKYNALKTLSAARREHPGLIELQTQSVVSRLDLDPVSGLITGVRYRQYQDESGPPDPTESVARGRLYVVAANSIEAARLLLASGAANSSDQVGRNLMDHPVLLAWALAQEAVGGFRGPGSTSNVPSFRDGPFRRQHSAFISPIDNWGWSWPAFAPASTLSQLMNPRDQGGEGLFGAALRRRLSHLVSRQVTFHYEFEQPPDPENRVTLDPVLKDPLGNARPRIRYSLADYTLAAMAAARSVSVQVFQRLGAEDHTDYHPGAPGYVTYQGKGYVFNGAGHLVGTHRMGSSRSNSVVSPQQRTWDHPNLFLVGCGNMPTLGTSNPTLTMAALADWAGDHIVRDLTP